MRTTKRAWIGVSCAVALSAWGAVFLGQPVGAQGPAFTQAQAAGGRRGLPAALRVVSRRAARRRSIWRRV